MSRSISNAIESLEARRLFSQTFYVSPTGSDSNPGTSPKQAWQHVQKAFDAAPAGATVHVLPGRYRESLTLHVSGTADAGFTTFVADGKVILDGSTLKGPILTINAASYVRIQGFTLSNYHTRTGGAALLFEGSGDQVQILNNTVSHTRGFEATAIGIYGTDSTKPITNLLVDGNEIYNAHPADSETLTLNGNVSGFVVSHNLVHDTNNIGIDFIGGEGTSVDPATGKADPATDTARNGFCQDNIVYREHANYGGGYGAGIYVDGGKDIVIQRNTVDHCDLGIEVGCEHAGRTVTGVAVRDNLLYANRGAGLAFGGYDAKVGFVQNCTFTNNTLYRNQTRRDGNGEVWVQRASRNLVDNNIISVGPQGVAVSGDPGSVGNTLNYNLFDGPGGADKLKFSTNGNRTTGLAAFQQVSGLEANSQFGDPGFANPRAPDFRPGSSSPAVNIGDPGRVPATDELDLLGQTRLQGGRIDAGATEVR